jgi:hypothetical protein
VENLAVVIDTVFRKHVEKVKGRADVTFAPTRLLARDDEPATAFAAHQGAICDAAIEFEVSRVLALVHMHVVGGSVPTAKRNDPHVRVPALEEGIADVLKKRSPDSAVPSVYVFAFHHFGELWRLLESSDFSANFVRRLLNVADAAQSALTQLDRLKHDLLKPFTSIRLDLGLVRNDESKRQLLDRFAKAAAGARALAAATNVPDDAHSKEQMVAVQALLDEERIAAAARDPQALEFWFDALNSAIDELRRQVR